MESFTLGFIGFGEAAYHIAKGLAETSKQHVAAFDVMAAKEPEGAKIRLRAQETGVALVDSLQQLIDVSNIILCATSAKYALSIAKEASEFLNVQKIYADLNSASPMVKRQIAQIIDRTGATFSDSAVMEIVPPHKHRVPIAASGSGAAAFAEKLNSIGMQVTYINNEAGSSSSMKMFRSVFMKGLTSLMTETFLAAYKMGVCDEVVESVSATLRENSIEQMANMLINRTAVAYERRISEMEDVAKTLQELGIDPFASRSTIERFSWMQDIGLKERLGGTVPDDFHKVLHVALNS